MGGISTKKLIAISSNSFPDHDRSDYITVTWRLLVRCNYDCSYCPPILHDLLSDIPPIEKLIQAADRINIRAQSINKKVYYLLTGGEPYLIKEFNRFLEYVHRLPNTIGVNVSTNASVPLRIYKKSFEYVKHLVLSLHIEVEPDSLQDRIDRVIALSRLNREKIVVMIMLEKGHFKQARDIVDQLQKHNVRFWLKLVQPQLSVDLVTFNPPGTGGKYVSASGKNYLTENYTKVINSYYSKEELNMVAELAQQEDENIFKCVWDDKTITNESITELLYKTNNSFMGWTCYAGILQFEILHDGEIYVGMCLSNGSFGNIYTDQIKWPEVPLKCPTKFCIDTTDIAVPKHITI